MSYAIVYQCDWPDGCRETFAEGIPSRDPSATAAAAGWDLTDDFDLCPQHVRTFVPPFPAPRTDPDLAPVPEDLVAALHAPEPATAAPDEKGTGTGNGWLARYLRPGTRVRGQHAAHR